MGWERPNTDTIRWRGEDKGREVLWESVACYDTNDLYVGRTPRLTIGGEAQPPEAAAEYGQRLGRESKWVLGSD